MDWPDQHHLNGAIGWLALGNTQEARADFEQLTQRHRQLPEALSFEWQLLAAERRWETAVEVADRWTRVAPDAAEAWIQRSFALHEQRATQEAWDKLLPAATLFPTVSTIAYNLACYACQLGHLDAGRRWLRRAMRMLKDKAERLVWATAAQQDEDLKPLWDEIRNGSIG